MSDNFNDFNDFKETNGQENPQDNVSSYVSENNSNSSKPPKKHSGLKAIAFVLCMAIVGGGSVQAYKYYQENSPKVSVFNEDDSSSESSESTDLSSSSESSESSDSDDDDDDEAMPSLIELASRTDSMSIPDIVDELEPSVVGVSSTFEYEAQSSFGGWGWGGYGGGQTQSEEIVGTGTGIIMTEDGYIVTNAHVVYDDSEYDCGEAVEVSVLFSDESEQSAKIIAYDTETDIAVLKVDATGLKPATFGDSDDIRVGELVIAIGNPLGFDLFGSVTSGIVSGLNRQISINEKNMNLIQIDAAINSGNSGGPLVNSCGQVIGINSAKMSSSYSSSASIEGLGFAIPINEAKTIIDDLINYKYVKGRPQIGIGTRDVSETISRYYNIPMGVYIVSVEEGSTAEFAGLQVGDVIIGIQGEAITTADELNEIKNQYKAGEEITLTITRDGEDMDISLVLQEANANSSSENSDDDDDSDTSSDSNDDVEESPSR
jgi:serine protease Do